jgi:hypothetical protein
MLASFNRTGHSERRSSKLTLKGRLHKSKKKPFYLGEFRKVVDIFNGKKFRKIAFQFILPPYSTQNKYTTILLLWFSRLNFAFRGQAASIGESFPTFRKTMQLSSG